MGEEENDEEVEEGKMPAYPRSMLRLDLSDGRRVMKAIEYRSIMELQLGETALGAKVSAIRIFPSLTSQLLVHNVRALRGTREYDFLLDSGPVLNTSSPPITPEYTGIRLPG